MKWTTPVLVLCTWVGAATAGPVDDVLAANPDFQGLVGVDRQTTEPSYWTQGTKPDGTAFTRDDVWRWASVTKQIVATLIMQEVAKGNMSLDDTVGATLPGIKTRYADDITVRRLLQHTSGLAQLRGLPKPDSDPAMVCDVRGKRKPGERFEYNNCDTALAAAILEAKVGTPWAERMQANIFDPAGMTGTIAKVVGQEGETVVGTFDGKPEKPIDVALYGAAGNLIGPAGDLLKFNKALMKGELLPDDARDVLWEGVPSLGFVALGAWSFEAQLDGCEGPTHLVERRGNIGGISIRNIIAPDLDVSLVALTNDGDLDFGEIWMRQGLSYELITAAFCSGE